MTLCEGISSFSSRISNPPIFAVPAGMKSCVMPSVAEIFIVSGVAVGTSVDVASGVDMVGIRVGVFSGASMAVDGGGVAALWQADRKMMRRRNGVIFFIGYIVSSLRGRCAKRSARSNLCIVEGDWSSRWSTVRVAGKDRPSSQ